MTIYRVYRYDFPDGSAYVGRTKMPIAHRHWTHRSSPVNAYLYCQMREYPDVSPVEVSWHHSEAAAANRERDEIGKLARPLNEAWRGTDRYRPPRWYPLPDDSPALKRRLGWSGRTREAQRRRDRRRNYGRVADDVMVRCRICYETKCASDYFSSRHRHNGLSSRCKSCCAYIGALRQLGLYADIPPEITYVRALRHLRAGEPQRVLKYGHG